MPPFYHTGHFSQTFDRIIRRVEVHLASKVRALGEFDAEVVRQRLTQAIVATGFDSFVSLCARRLANKQNLTPQDDQPIHINGLIIVPSNGRVIISLRLFAKSMIEFSYFWLLFLRSIFFGMFPWPGRDDRPATLILGLGIAPLLYQESDARFLEFCRQGPILPLSQATRLLIQTPERTGYLSNPDVVYARNPLCVLTHQARLGWVGRARLILSHLQTPLRFLGTLLRFPAMGLLARDIVSAPLVHALDRAGMIQAVIISNSSYLSHQLWMRGPASRHFKVHNIFYSQNTRLFQYIRDPLVVELPAYRHVRVDEHWVWTPGYKAHLESLGHRGPCHVVGPILWYLPAPPLPRPKDDEFWVVVFDVTPVYTKVADRIGVFNNYYCTDTMLRFVEEIIDACDELGAKMNRQIRISLKHKRDPIPGNHDHRYLNRIDQLLTSHDRFDLIPPETNLFSLLGACDLSIAAPYTSTAYISSHLQKPAIYFDPTKELLPTLEPSPYVRFASGRVKLMRAIEHGIAGAEQNA